MTVDEIMTAYKQACQKLNCKQIPKLLKQIQVELVRVLSQHQMIKYNPLFHDLP